MKTYLLIFLIVACSVPSVFANHTAESKIRLLVLGDSLTAGYGLLENEAFPVQLEKALQSAGHDIEVINAGVSGDTSAGGLARLEWALKSEPHIVVIELGANDALRGLPAKETTANLNAILARLKRAGVAVLLAGMKAPRNFGEHYTQEFDQIYPLLAKRHKVALYPFFLEGVALVPSLNQADGIHPNADGVKVIVERILPVLASVIKNAAQK